MAENPKEISKKDLPTSTKDLWLKAQAAIEMKNHSYSISLLKAILKTAPGFLEGRKALRKSAIQLILEQQPKKKGFFGSSNKGSALGQLKLQSQSKKDPLNALALIEDELEEDPTSPSLNEILFDTSMRLNLLDTAAFSLEVIRAHVPENTKLLHRLADHYMARDMPSEAEGVFNDIVKQDPTDIDAVKGAKDASARASMQKQKWQETADFTEMIKDEEETTSLERDSQAGMTYEQMEEARDRALALYENDSHNLPTVKKLAHLYERLEDWENAHNFFAWAFELSQGDESLKNKASLMGDKFSEYQITQAELALTQDPDNQTLQEELQEMKDALLQKKLTEAKKRVELNPTDPQNRYDLGHALYQLKSFSEAISHLQQAKRSPHIRTRVLLLLAQTFSAKGMNDLALKQLEDANSELQAMDSTKKEILYEMGVLHTAMNHSEEALSCFKQIYEADYSYRDVAQRVESSYSEA